MKLNKKQREELKQKYGGRCAYCGAVLEDRWHADHFNPVERVMKWVTGKGFTPTGEMVFPENDTFENMMPACAPCNIDKHNLPLEYWRKKLSRGVEVLTRNNPTYRHAKRFGLVEETDKPIVFYFETYTEGSER